MINGKKVAAIIAAAGSGKRMGLGYNKLFCDLGGKTVIERTLTVFENCDMIDAVIITASKSDMERMLQIANDFPKVINIIKGGSTRSESIAKALEGTDGFDKIAIHDGARAMICEDIIERVIADSEQTGAAAVGVKATDTMKIADDDGYIKLTPDRNSLWHIQTPQVFNADIIKKAYKNSNGSATDDAQLAEQMGIKVKITNGSYSNIKITTASDLDTARAYFNKDTGIRIGYGYDAHCLCKGRKLYIGGELIEHDKGLEGHSDADVLLHAISDALLGAAALGDIGVHFPPSDIKYKDISSLLLLERVYELIQTAGYKPGNIDATITAQKPKLTPYIPKMRENIANILKTDIQNISIKATTTEKMGFEGREEGISATAVCILRRNMI